MNGDRADFLGKRGPKKGEGGRPRGSYGPFKFDDEYHRIQREIMRKSRQSQREIKREVGRDWRKVKVKK